MSDPRQQLMTQQEYDKKLDAIKVCGTNRGPHDYIPVAWVKRDNELKKNSEEMVTTLMCRICFCRVNTNTLYEHFREVKV